MVPTRQKPAVFILRLWPQPRLPIVSTQVLAAPRLPWPWLLSRGTASGTPRTTRCPCRGTSCGRLLLGRERLGSNGSGCSSRGLRI